MAESVQADTVAQSSPLLNLPLEILEIILKKHFQYAALLVIRDDNSKYPTKTRIVGMPSLKIERACKALRDLSLTIRTKVISRHLIAYDREFVRRIRKFACTPAMKWVCEHITSVQGRLEPDPSGVIWSWPRPMVRRFPNLKDFNFHNELRLTCAPWVERQYLPLDSDESRRKLAKDVVAGDWIRADTRLSIQSRLYALEKDYHEAREHYARENLTYSGPSASDLNIRFTLTIVCVSRRDGPRTELYKAVRIAPPVFCRTRAGFDNRQRCTNLKAGKVTNHTKISVSLLYLRPAVSAISKRHTCAELRINLPSQPWVRLCKGWRLETSHTGAK